MFFPWTWLHAAHYYPLPSAVLQPVLMSTGHTPMYTSAVSTLVRAQWCMPPRKSAVSSSVIPVWFCVPIYRLGGICHRSNCGLSYQSVQSSSFYFLVFVMVKLKVIVASVCLCSLSFKSQFHVSSVNIVGPEYTNPVRLSKVVFSSHTDCQHASGILYLFVILKACNKIVQALIIARKVLWKVNINYCLVVQY